MKPIILSDQSTNLNNENIFIVTNEKSSLGQIAYSLDLISNGGKDIIYLSSHRNKNLKQFYYRTMLVLS